MVARCPALPRGASVPQEVLALRQVRPAVDSSLAEQPLPVEPEVPPGVLASGALGPSVVVAQEAPQLAVVEERVPPAVVRWQRPRAA